MMPRLGKKYDLEMETISKPRAQYQTDEYFALDLPVAPAVMVGEEVLVEGSDLSEAQLEAAIRRHLGLTEEEPSPKGLFKRLFRT
jgi:hypothetical protein